MKSIETELESGLKLLDFSDFDQQYLITKLTTYIKLIEKWNRVYNLTAVRDPIDMVNRHIIDSLMVAPHMKTSGDLILDVGTGAGLPGIPLSVVFPHKKFTLLDSSQKKQIFLQHVVQSLALNNVSLQCIRTEAYRPDFQFNTIVSRAFAPLGKMLALTGHLLAPEGQFLAMKGKLDPEEFASIGSDYKVTQVIPLSLFGHLVIIMRN